MTRTLWSIASATLWTVMTAALLVMASSIWFGELHLAVVCALVALVAAFGGAEAATKAGI